MANQVGQFIISADTDGLLTNNKVIIQGILFTRSSNNAHYVEIQDKNGNLIEKVSCGVNGTIYHGFKKAFVADGLRFRKVSTGQVTIYLEA